MGLAFPPKRIRQPSQAIDQSLGDQEKHCDFNDDELSRMGDDTQRNDQSGCPRRRMTGSQQHHESTRSRERKSGSEDSWPVDRA